MREKSEELRGAVEGWQARADCSEGASAPPRPRLLACFLDGAHPIVDVYELKVRLRPGSWPVKRQAHRHPR